MEAVTGKPVKKFKSGEVLVDDYNSVVLRTSSGIPIAFSVEKKDLYSIEDFDKDRELLLSGEKNVVDITYGMVPNEHYYTGKIHTYRSVNSTRTSVNVPINRLFRISHGEYLKLRNKARRIIEGNIRREAKKQAKLYKDRNKSAKKRD